MKFRSSLLAFVLVVAAVPSGLVSAQSVTSSIKPDAFVPDPSEPWSAITRALVPRSIGPVNMGGRITDVAVYEKDPRIIYVASASGGLWKTVNGGTTFFPVFEREGSISLGAVAVDPNNPDVVWVGTGEDTSRNSVAWGDGVYKSIDGGKTWKNVGLKESMHVGDIYVDPKNPDTVYVGALGRLWGSNPERGLYKTTDGGKSWNQILKSDENTGVIRIEPHPKDTRTFLVVLWERRRFAYDFISGGPGSALLKTTDGGKSFKKITKGIPSGTIGRIGLQYCRTKPNVLYATIEHKPAPPKPEEKKDEKMPATPAPQARMNGGGTFRSDDGGESWKQVNTLNPRPFYFSLPIVDPNNPETVYLWGANWYKSVDGGKTFKSQPGNVHPDFHDIWINPNDSNWILAGHDGGLSQSRDGGVTWDHLNGMPLAQYYAVAVDQRKPYWIYGGLQDNQCWGLPTQTSTGGVSFFHTVSLGGGDGFYCQVDPQEWWTVYSESQGGSMVRTDLKSGAARSIQPRIQGERLRFNWNTPFMLSPHNGRTIYAGANKLFKSVNRGDSWVAISPDLTTNDPEKLKAGQRSVTPEATGAEMHCTIVTVGESPIKPGLLYVGTDDGLVHVSQDDGKTWTNLTPNIPDLPKNTWCSRVRPSKWVEGRVYATFDGHRNNDFKPYVYQSNDFGRTWVKLHESLPEGDSVYVITEGLQNPNLLFLGSEMSLRVSLDLGKTWGRVRNTFPTVAVHDLLIHPRDGDLVIGTHGRGLYTLDVTGLEALTETALKADVVLGKPQTVLNIGRTTGSEWEGDKLFVARNTQPGTKIFYHLAKKPGTVKLKVTSADGARSVELTPTSEVGLNVVTWNGRVEGRTVIPGDYRVVLTVDGKEYVSSVRVEEAFLNKD